MVAIRADVREVPVLKPADVRFGLPKADICSANSHVCSTLNSDCKSGHGGRRAARTNARARRAGGGWTADRTPKYAGLLCTTCREFCLQ
jgi:hypothetical protein